MPRTQPTTSAPRSRAAARVPARTRLIALALAVLAGPVFVTPAAQAVDGGDLEFQVAGTLSPFPASGGRTSFDGSGTGAASVTGAYLGVTYATVLTVQALPVNGWASYSEPAWPVCPLVGSASQSGQVSLGAATLPGVGGVAYAVGQTAVGTVTGVTISFDFTYERVGPAAVLQLKNGMVSVYFTMPDGVSGFVSSPFIGGAVGVLTFDPVQAEQDCLANTGSLDFTLTGNAAVAGQ